MDSEKLLREFTKTGSDNAFAQLVSRYIGLVYATAVRLVGGDTHRAEDVAQTVFVDLARMAGTLSGEVSLGGWLHRHTCWVAAKVMRGERRRQLHEQQALLMNSQDDHSGATLAALAPILDDAINRLGSQDRSAIVLRFFEQCDLRSVGKALGTNEDAAQKRVSRALEKLRVVLTTRGVIYSAASIGAAMSGVAVSGAPPELAATIAGAALSGKAAGSGAALAFIKLMTMTKIKVAIVSAMAVVAVAVPVTLQQHQQLDELRRENQRLGGQIAQFEQENQRLAQRAAKVSTQTLGSNQMTELLRLRNEVGLLRNRKAEADKLRAALAQSQAASEHTGRASAPPLQTNDPVLLSGLRETSVPEALKPTIDCINNLLRINSAKRQWTLKYEKTSTDTPAMNDLMPYLGRGPGDDLPVCPAGGSYTIGRMDQEPTCSIPGHALPHPLNPSNPSGLFAP